MKKWGITIGSSNNEEIQAEKTHFQNINQQITLVGINTFTVDFLVAGKIDL
jgi:hypothetical protein